jgi:hypothetical protein
MKCIYGFLAFSEFVLLSSKAYELLVDGIACNITSDATVR